jgi:hypothetical protein
MGSRLRYAVRVGKGHADCSGDRAGVVMRELETSLQQATPTLDITPDIVTLIDRP